MKRAKVLLTGATGNMGVEGLKQLAANPIKYHVIVFALPTNKDKKLLKKYEHHKNVSIVWGDLANYVDVKNAVDEVDIVLHVGALVSPMADHKPDLAWKVNFDGTKNIVDALRARSDSDKVKLVYIGTVAETGNRTAPYHWGRIGDPLFPSIFDNYALSKIAAERYVIESGLKNWVSLRQTAIMHEKLLDVNDGIGYHMPLNSKLEWITARDSGRLLLNICSEDIPKEFWNNLYNIGGGATCRFTGFQFLNSIYSMLGVDFRELEHPNWYALRNFHGHWYYDSDKLDDYLHFRSESVDDVIARIKKKLPLSFRLLVYLPKKIVTIIMRKKALNGDTPLMWIKNNKEDKIKAFFGSKEKWKEIPDWDKFVGVVDLPHEKLNHGWDESITDNELALEHIKRAAEYRGGKCLSTNMITGDLKTKLKWICALGHEFRASPYLVLKTGHWCEECMKPPWNFDEQAKLNPFIAQVWNAQ